MTNDELQDLAYQQAVAANMHNLFRSAAFGELMAAIPRERTDADDADDYAHDHITLAELERRIEQRWNKP